MSICAYNAAMNIKNLVVEEAITAGGIYGRRAYTDKKHPPLALVMGYGGSGRIWPDTFVNRLAESFVVIIYDNCGTGKSVVPQDPAVYSIKGMAADLKSVLDLFEVAAVNLFGYSMGGCIALQYAHDFAGTVKSLTLLSSTAGGALYVKADPVISAMLANPPGNTLWEIYLSTFSLMYSPAKLKEFEPVLRQLYENSKDVATTPRALQGHSFAFKNFDGSSYLSGLKVPVTVIAGSDDRLMPVQNSHHIVAAISQARLVLVPDCEHAAHIQNEDLVIAEIEKTAK